MERQLMEVEANSIQKFTDADSVQTILRSVYRLTTENISLLSPDKKDELSYCIRHTLQSLDGEAYEAFFYKVKDIMTERYKNKTWDRNHERINRVIKQYVINNNRMPTVTEVAELANMSRVTVSKHLKDFDLLDYSREQRQMLTIMFNDMLGQLMANALQGDFASVKLIAEIMTKGGDNGKTVFKAKNQQNFIITIKVTLIKLVGWKGN